MNKKIKILFAINNLNLGGAEVVVTEQIKNIDKKKFDVSLAVLYKSKEPNLISQVNFLGEKKFRQFNFKNKKIFSFSKWGAVYKFLKQEKFDVVYCHLFETNLIFRCLAYWLKTPVIVSFEHSQYFNKRRWQIIADQICARLTDKIIVSTKSVAEFTAKQEKINPDKFFVIPNPVSLPDKNKIDLIALRQSLGLTENDFIVLTLGRFSEEKGLDFILQAAKKLDNKISNIKFLLIGYGPLEQKLRKDIKDYGLEKYCQLVLEPKRAKEYLYLGNIFLLTSLREGQSIATYEAMMAGLPVIAFRVGGAVDIIKDGENGLLLPIGDVDGLAEKITYLYHNENIRKGLAEQAKTSVERYDAENNIKIFESLLDSLFYKKSDG